MEDSQDLKESIKNSLENHFIDNKPSVEREMSLLNVLISTFDKDCEYTYDEYCNKRIIFEIEACDKVVDVNVEETMKLTGFDKSVIGTRTNNRAIDESEELGYEDILKEEYVNLLLEKCYEVDSKMYYQISKYSSMKLIESKISKEIWEQRKEYFEGICEHKSQSFGKHTAEVNRSKHKEDILDSLQLEDLF